MVTKFYIRLLAKEYDENTGWQCGALALPSARVRKLIVGGTELPPNKFTIEGPYIQLIGSPTTLPAADAAVLLEIERKLVRLDTAIVVALIGAAATFGAAWLSGPSRQTLDCPERVCPKLECPAVAQTPPPPESQSREARPEPGEIPSLLQAFRGGTPQEFSGAGTRTPPSCQYSGGELVVTIPSGYSAFAGCYLEVEKPLNLRGFLNGIVRVELAAPAKRLEIKLEAGSQGAGRSEVFVVKAPAAAGAHAFPVRDVPHQILDNASRFTVAINGSGEGNTITVRE